MTKLTEIVFRYKGRIIFIKEFNEEIDLDDFTMEIEDSSIKECIDITPELKNDRSLTGWTNIILDK